MAMNVQRQRFDAISSSAMHPLGYRTTRDGTSNEYVYCKAGAADLHPGMMGVAAADVDNHINLAVATSAAIGAKSVQVTLGATAATENQYADGTLSVNDGTGEGHTYIIESHPAADSAGDLWVTLRSDSRIKIALVAGTSEVTLNVHPCSGVVESATEENVSIGVATVAVTTLYYYWAQVQGPIAVLMDSTPAVGTSLVNGSVAGSLKAIPTALDVDMCQSVGQKVGGAGVDTEYGLVYLSM